MLVMCCWRIACGTSNEGIPVRVWLNAKRKDPSSAKVDASAPKCVLKYLWWSPLDCGQCSLSASSMSLCVFGSLGKSALAMLNAIGPMEDPCGTPALIVPILLSVLPILVLKVRSLRNSER